MTCTYKFDPPCFISWETDYFTGKSTPAEQGGGVDLLLNGKKVLHTTWTDSSRARVEADLKFIAESVNNRERYLG